MGSHTTEYQTSAINKPLETGGSMASNYKIEAKSLLKNSG